MKRFTAILLCLCMLLTVCACRGGENPATNGESANNFEATATEKNPTVMGMFYRNVTGADLVSDDPAVKQVDEKADAMLKKIEEYSDSIKVANGGNTYYVSNDGDDKNDGLTPETARQNYYAVKSFLKEGDAVLFRRGDLFRGNVSLVSGVSYGAYGEGVKPRIYGSVDASKNGNGVWEETETAGVWRYNKNITDYCNIIFNNGEAIGRPVQKMEDITKNELNVVYKGGKVYLYCPKGNPADVYSVIEIVEAITAVTGTDNPKNIHIQNLCIMYANFGIGGMPNSQNIEIDGCIIGYMGGKNLYTGAGSLGNGIELWGNVHAANVHDNYIFQCFDAGITHQSNNGMSYSVDQDDIHYTNNLIEYCLYSIEAFVPQKDTGTSFDYPAYFENYTSRMGDVYIENNICRYAGFGWGTLDRKTTAACHLQYRAGMHEETLKISGNIFDRPRNAVAFFSTVPDKSLMVFTDNTILLAAKRKVYSMESDSINMHEDVTSFSGKYFADYSGTKCIEVSN